MTRRSKRVASLLQMEIAQALVTEVADPDLHHVHISSVSVSPDLKQARVFYEASSNDDKRVLAALKRARPYFRKRVSQSVQLRCVPELMFERDTKSAQVANVLSILSQLECSRPGEPI